MKKCYKLAPVLLAALGLAACSGGGSTSYSTSPSGEPVQATEQADDTDETQADEKEAGDTTTPRAAEGDASVSKVNLMKACFAKKMNDLGYENTWGSNGPTMAMNPELAAGQPATVEAEQAPTGAKAGPGQRGGEYQVMHDCCANSGLQSNDVLKEAADDATSVKAMQLQGVLRGAKNFSDVVDLLNSKGYCI